MSVLWITIPLSMVLALMFLALFLRDQRRGRFGSPERSSLLPLEDDLPAGKQGRSLKN